MRIRIGIALILGLAMPALAQQADPVQIINGGAPVSNSNPLPVSASVLASVTGFAPATTGTPISVTTGGVTGTLPAGTVVVAFNTGATNTAYCKLGASATTSDIAIPPASWFSYTVGAATQLTCITSTSTTTVNMVGGSGLPTGAGGGGGGGGGGSNASVSATGSAVPASATYVGIISGGNLTGWNGAVTQATAASLNATVVGTGTFVTQSTLNAETTKVIGTVRNLGNAGAITDFAGQNASSPANAWLMGGQFNTSPTTITNGNASPLQLDNAGKLLVNCTGCSSSGSITSWGGGTLGAMANYGTSPGAVLVPGVNAYVTNTNANGQVALASSSPVAVAKNSGTGSTVAGAAVGTAGSASAEVVTVQGVASMTPVLVTGQAGTNRIGYTSDDPCTQGVKTNLPISFQTTSITQQIPLSGSTKIYVCSLSLIASAATVFSITGGTGTNCGTPAALIGTTSATHGLSLAANGGLTLGNGAGTVAVTGAGSELCLVQSGAGDLVGNLTYVQQ